MTTREPAVPLYCCAACVGSGPCMQLGNVSMLAADWLDAFTACSFKNNHLWVACRLCYEARLVLETHNLRKREFATVGAACQCGCCSVGDDSYVGCGEGAVLGGGT